MQRGLPAYHERAEAFPADVQEEIAGIAAGAGVAKEAVLTLNALIGDLGHVVPPIPGADTPTRWTRGCAVAAHGTATSMGQILHAASFAPDVSLQLERSTRVFVVEPLDGHPFVHASLVGFAGSFAGLNACGISASYEVFPGPAQAPAGALPAPFLLRRILRDADDLAEAEAIVRQQPLTTGARILIADGRRLDTRAIERFGEHVNVRRSFDGLLFGEDPTARVECFVGQCDPAVPRGEGQEEPALRNAVEGATGTVRGEFLEKALLDSAVRGEGAAISVVMEPQRLRFEYALGSAHSALLPAAPPPAPTWSTLDLLTAISPGKRALYAPPWPVTETGTFVVAKESTLIGDVTLTHVTFDSPAPSGHAYNDRIRAVWYRPKEPKAAVISLPAWKDPNLAGQGLMALQLARAGYAVLVMPLPWQADRTPPGVSSGSWTLSADLARTRAALLQGAADVARASLWLEKEQGFPPKRQGVMGLSLGGHAAALAFGAYPDRFASGIFLLTGGRLETAMLNENRILRRIRQTLVEHGVTPEEATDLIHGVDGVTWANPARKASVLLVGADKDDVIPPANVRALAEAYGGARTEWIPGDHLAILLHLPTALDWVVGHLDATLKAP